MLYSTLTDNELEKWCNASPTDRRAKAEMLRRAPKLMFRESAYLKEVEDQRDELMSENTCLREELAEFD